MKPFNLDETQENIENTLLLNTIGRTTDVCRFVSMLSLVDGGCSIGIDGRWGTGKTFFVKQAKMIVDSLNPNTNSPKNFEVIQKLYYDTMGDEEELYPPLVTAYYDAWRHDAEVDPILSLVYEISKDNKPYAISNKRSVPEIIGAIADLVPGMNTSGFVTALKGKDFFEETNDNVTLEVEIKEFFSCILQEKGDKLIVFVDELDRCSPKYAVKFLERVKHYFEHEKVIFVFSVNIAELQNTIKSYYGDGFDACRYLDRFFDIRMTLPDIDSRNYIKKVLGFQSYGLHETVCEEIVRQKNMSMRETSRYIQMSKVAAYKYTSINTYDETQKVIAFYVVVPIAIGLNMTSTSEYRDFIDGKDGIWLETILLLDDCSYFCENFLTSDESYSDEEGMNKVSKQQKIKEVYDAIFVKDYDTIREHVIKIGSAKFTKGLKESILKALCFVSPYTQIDHTD